MSDQPNQDDVVQLASEYREVQRRLQARTQQLEALLAVNAEAGDFPASNFDGIRNRRYSVDFVFTPDENLVSEIYARDGELTQEQDVIVDAGTIFRCAYVESFLQAVGAAVDPYSGDSTTAQVTVPWNVRLQAFDFFWRIRDTGSDREWCGTPQPSLFLGGGYWGPLWLPKRNILGGGTVISVQVNPFLINGSGNALNFFGSGGTISKYLLQVSFVGHDVQDGSEL